MATASNVEMWLSDDSLVLIEAWARDGYTKDEIAKKMGVSLSALMVWQNEYPCIKEALRVGKELVDYKVENALLKAALGYTTKEIKVTLGKKIINGESFQLLKETTTKYVGPNVTACIAWLNNRKHDQWKRNRDRVVELNEEDSNVTVTIIRGNNQKPQGDGVKFENVDLNRQPVALDDESASNPPLDYWPDDWNDEDE